MFFSSLLIALAITWLVAVVDTVYESASVAATKIVMFGRTLYVPETQEIGVWIVCGLSASAMLALVTALATVRGRRLRRRLAEELAEVERSKMREVGDVALAQLLPNRISELQTSVDTLTAQRDAILTEIREAQEQRSTPVVVVPEPAEAEANEGLDEGGEAPDEAEGSVADQPASTDVGGTKTIA
jgi:hypothetical protein